MDETLDAKIAANYATLSAKLRQAADFVVKNPVDTATRSLRSVAQESGIAPATFSRLARALDFDSFDDLRDVLRAAIGKQVKSFSERAKRLQSAHSEGRTSFRSAHLSACINNLTQMGDRLDPGQMEATVERLHGARNVLLLGALGSTGIMEYMSYMANFFSENWNLASRMGASLGSGLASLDERDALIIMTKPPFASQSIRAAELARAQGAYVVVITDTYACPALKHASSGYIVPTDSPHFYSSYTATLFLVETLIGMLAGRAGRRAQERIEDVQTKNRQLGEVWEESF